MVAHGVGVPSNHSTAELSILIRDGTAAKSDHVVLSQPNTKAHCPIPAVKLLSQANALVISNAT